MCTLNNEAGGCHGREYDRAGRQAGGKRLITGRKGSVVMYTTGQGGGIDASQLPPSMPHTTTPINIQPQSIPQLNHMTLIP